MGGAVAGLNKTATSILGDDIGGAFVQLGDPLDIFGGQAYQANEDATIAADKQFDEMMVAENERISKSNEGAEYRASHQIQI